MFFNNVRRELAEAHDKLDDLATSVAKLEAALVVRDPGTARSVEAYDGLRRQVIASSAERRRLLVMLVHLQRALAQGVSAHDLGSLVEEWTLEAGLEEITDAEKAEFFDYIDDGMDSDDSSPAAQVALSAWKDRQTGAVVARGIARRRHMKGED